MLPIKELNAIFLFEQTDIIIKSVKQVGGELVAIICDSNRVNQSSFRMFDTHIEKPWCNEDDTFLLFDYVHLLKNIRNRWITEKTQKLSFELNCEQMTAKWSDSRSCIN